MRSTSRKRLARCASINPVQSCPCTGVDVSRAARSRSDTRGDGCAKGTAMRTLMCCLFHPRRHQFGRSRVRLLTPFLLGHARAGAGLWRRLVGGVFVHACSVFFFFGNDMATDGNSK